MSDNVHSQWNKNVAVEHLRNHAGNTSQSRCAQYVRQAIEAGGIRIDRKQNAKDYGTSLIRAGFHEVPSGEALRAGDVAVIQPYPRGNPAGHMTMYDGQRWYSDFAQRDMYPGPRYRTHRPSYKVYRKN